MAMVASATSLNGERKADDQSSFQWSRGRAHTLPNCPSRESNLMIGTSLEGGLAECEATLKALEARLWDLDMTPVCTIVGDSAQSLKGELLQLASRLEDISAEALAGGCSRSPGAMDCFNQATEAIERIVSFMDICTRIATEEAKNKKAAEDLKDLWSTSQTFQIDAQFGKDVQVLDQVLVSGSVRKAVDGLNDGSIECSAGICIAYSSGREAYYILYSRHKEQAALNKFNKKLCN